MRKPCGLITIIPAALEAKWAEGLPEFVAQFKPAGLILQGPLTSVLAEILSKAKAVNLAVLLIDSIHKTREIGADGVYLSTPGAGISNVRRELGASAIIGAACGLSRHMAMESAEAGADFVTFDASTAENLSQGAELTSWWDEISGVPCALFCDNHAPARPILAQANCDFIILRESDRPGESLNFATELGLQSQS